jgi:hypothetical protein
MAFVVNLQQKMGSLLFNTVYYINGTTAEQVQTNFDALLTARAEIQTVDVEYLSATATQQGVVNPVIINLNLVASQGAATGATAPAGMFLTFRKSHNTGRQSSERLRGYVINELTEASVFGLDFGGDSDQPDGDGATATIPGRTAYGLAIIEYLSSQISSCVSVDGRVVTGYSRRVSTGYRPIRRAI